MSKYDPEQYRLWYEKNAKKKRDYARRYYAENRSARLQWAKEWDLKNPGKRVERHRERRYGVTPQDLQKMLFDQDGKCAICTMILDSSTKRSTPHVDHCHATGRSRGVLCLTCNASLGRLEKPGFLEAALAYLKRSGQ